MQWGMRAVLGARGVNDAVEVAGQIVQAATDDAKALTAERDEAERRSLLHTVGIAEGQAVPPAVRSQINALEEEQKQRAKRSVHSPEAGSPAMDRDLKRRVFVPRGG